MSTYTDAHKKYYRKNKDTIYRRTKKYKEEYNRAYHLKRKEEKAKKVEESLKKESIPS